MAKTSEVTDFLKFVVGLSMIATIDDKGYVVNLKSGDKILVEDREKHPMMVYQEVMEDKGALILTPFSEGMVQNAAVNWFYRALKLSFTTRLTNTAKTILLRIANHDPKLIKDEYVPSEILRITSALLEQGIDLKMVDEFSELCKDPLEFIHINHIRRHRQAVVDIPFLMVLDYKDKFPKIRKKSWMVFEKLILSILQISSTQEMDQFTTSADTRLECTFDAVYRLYSKTNLLFEQMSDGAVDLSIDLTQMKQHLNRIPEYFDNAKWLNQTSAASSKPVVSSTQPFSMSAPTAQPAAAQYVPVTMSGGGGGGGHTVATSFATAPINPTQQQPQSQFIPVTAIESCQAPQTNTLFGTQPPNTAGLATFGTQPIYPNMVTQQPTGNFQFQPNFPQNGGYPATMPGMPSRQWF